MEKRRIILLIAVFVINGCLIFYGISKANQKEDPDCGNVARDHDTLVSIEKYYNELCLEQVKTNSDMKAYLGVSYPVKVYSLDDECVYVHMDTQGNKYLPSEFLYLYDDKLSLKERCINDNERIEKVSKEKLNLLGEMKITVPTLEELENQN